jgi:hypothetical protein
MHVQTVWIGNTLQFSVSKVRADNIHPLQRKFKKKLPFHISIYVIFDLKL